MPAAASDADHDLTAAEVNRARAIAMVSDFGRFLGESRKLDGNAIGFAMILIGTSHLRVSPDSHDLALVRSLVTAMNEIIQPDEPRH